MFSFGLVIFLATYVLFRRSQEDSNKQSSISKFQGDTCCISTTASAPGYGSSIYQDSSVWKDQNGNVEMLASFRGKIVVLSMFYSHCAISCPLIINDMKKVEQRISFCDSGKVVFVLITIDPLRDSPAVLHALSERQNLDQKKWILLTGDEDAVQGLAALLGVSFIKKENGDFDHSNQIAILNRNGEISYKHFNVGSSVDDIVAAVDSLVLGG